MSAKTVEEIEVERAARKAKIATARAEQYAKDVVHVNELEIEHGDDRVRVMKMPSFVEGLPTVVVVATPEPAYFKRYRDKVRRAKGDQQAIGRAADELADVCIAYPDAETYRQMQESWPSIHDNASVEATKLGEAEGKD